MVAEGRLKGIFCFQGDMGCITVQLRGDGQNADNGVSAVHKGRLGKFRPALVKVCGAAAVIGLQAEKMCLTAVGAEKGLSGESLAGNLIAHLIVLMGPHILADGCRQGIKGHDLQPLCPFILPGEGIKKLTGIHLLHYSAELRALDGRKTGKTLVTGKGLHRGAVILLQHIVKPLRFIGILLAQEAAADCLILQHHANIDDMGLEGPLIHRPLPPPGKGGIVISLVLQDPGQLQDPVLRIAGIEKVHGNEALKPPGLSPPEEADPAAA